MRPDVAALLRCPHCAGRLRVDGQALRCGAGHAFDIARQGYVNLLPGRARVHTADTAEMVAARAAFLAAGHFEPLVAAVADVADVAAGGVSGRPGSGSVAGCPSASADAGEPVVDVGAGTGHYLAAVLDRLEGAVGLALDLSKHAARRAARAHPRIGAAVCDVWQPWPVRSGVAGLVLNVFAPRNGAELARILRPDGALVVVTPTVKHLREVVGPLGLLTVDADKEDRLESALGDRFTVRTRQAVEATMSLPHEDLRRLAAMGPSAWHTDPEALGAAIDALLEPVEVTLGVSISVHQLR